MITYITRRLLYFVPLLILVTIISFSILQLRPGNFLTKYRGSPRISEATIEQMSERYGLDEPAYVQYWQWIKGIITDLDFGYSFETQQPVFDLLFKGRVKWTMIIMFSTLLFSWTVGIFIGIYSAVHQYSLADHFFTFFGFLGLSIPNFFLALLLLYFLSVVLNIGPGLGVGGLFSSAYIGKPWSWGKFVNFLWHLWPAIVVMGTARMATVIRQMRGNLLDILGEQYVQTSRSKGLREWKVILKHAVRNAINPLITMLGFELPYLIGGALITSIVLNLPTVERAFYTALLSQDLYVAASGLLFFSFLLLVGNLIADILLAAVDPRIRYD
ncbi:ABC transporter permease [Candidatus Bipolaricaulota bacterium]|nr:ABC transporter permease [Candidatus Bipolaricaulota bacterium]